MELLLMQMQMLYKYGKHSSACICIHGSKTFKMCHTGSLNAAEYTHSVRSAWPARPLRLGTLWMGDAHNAFAHHVTCVGLEYLTFDGKKTQNKEKKEKILSKQDYPSAPMTIMGLRAGALEKEEGRGQQLRLPERICSNTGERRGSWRSILERHDFRWKNVTHTHTHSRGDGANRRPSNATWRGEHCAKDAAWRGRAAQTWHQAVCLWSLSLCVRCVRGRSQRSLEGDLAIATAWISVCFKLTAASASWERGGEKDWT